jgi:hypothetical protein
MQLEVADQFQTGATTSGRSPGSATRSRKARTRATHHGCSRDRVRARRSPSQDRQGDALLHSRGSRVRIGGEQGHQAADDDHAVAPRRPGPGHAHLLPGQVPGAVSSGHRDRRPARCAEGREAEAVDDLLACLQESAGVYVTAAAAVHAERSLQRRLLLHDGRWVLRSGGLSTPTERAVLLRR